MKPRGSRKGTAGVAPRTNLARISKQLTEIHLMQAQLNLLDAQMNRPPTWTQVAWSGKSSKDRAKELLSRRTQLMKKMTKAQANYTLTPTSKISPNVQKALFNFADHYFWPTWNVIPVPAMSEGFDQTPAYVGDTTASGDISAVSLGPGYVVFEGELSDSPQDPTEAWWAHTWACTVPFPRFDAQALMLYRFTVDAALGFYPEGVNHRCLRGISWSGSASEPQATLRPILSRPLT